MAEELDHRRWMERAQQLARAAAACDEVPVGAVLVWQGQIVAEGSNERESSKRTSGHAEMVALQKYNDRFATWRVAPGTSLYVTVEPCLMCTGALLWARLDFLYYGCPDTKNAGLRRIIPWIEEGVFDHRFKEVGGKICEEDCAFLLSDYFSKKRGKPLDR